jgi:bacteriocin-like protein
MMTTEYNNFRELTEQELQEVAGGTPSIPIPPPSHLVSFQTLSYSNLNHFLPLPPSPC